MNRKIKFFTVFFAMSCIFMCAAFAKAKNFEEVYAEKSEISLQYESACEQMKESYGSVFKDIKVYAEGDCLVYEYVYAIDIDDELVKESLETQLESMESMLSEVKKAVKKDFGCKKISVNVKYVYKNKDGKTVYEYKF